MTSSTPLPASEVKWCSICRSSRPYFCETPGCPFMAEDTPIATHPDNLVASLAVRLEECQQRLDAALTEAHDARERAHVAGLKLEKAERRIASLESDNEALTRERDGLRVAHNEAQVRCDGILTLHEDTVRDFKADVARLTAENARLREALQKLLNALEAESREEARCDRIHGNAVAFTDSELRRATERACAAITNAMVTITEARAALTGRAGE